MDDSTHHSHPADIYANSFIHSCQWIWRYCSFAKYKKVVHDRWHQWLGDWRSLCPTDPGWWRYLVQHDHAGQRGNDPKRVLPQSQYRLGDHELRRIKYWITVSHQRWRTDLGTFRCAVQ